MKKLKNTIGDLPDKDDLHYDAMDALEIDDYKAAEENVASS